jgi:hypothetical protein
VITTINILQSKRIGAAFYIGYSFYAQSVYPEIGIRAGAFQIGGTQATAPYLVMGCDYAFFGEELFCAGAYLSGDEKMMRTIGATDWLKVVTLTLFILGVIVLAGGSQIIINLMGA